MTIFMEPSSNNLSMVVTIINNFFRLSGLKISVTKTNAVWFGSKWDSDEILCPELGLKWVKNFTLLGIEFDNHLDNTRANLDKKLVCWRKCYQIGHTDI